MSAALATIHSATTHFRLPYIPSTAGGPLNAQTIEGGLFVWDGAGSQLDHGLAFQWILNPWMPSFGDIWTWSNANGGSWQPSGHLDPDLAWHQVDLQVDPTNGLVGLAIDGVSLSAEYTSLPKPGWGSEVAARLQMEAISIWPGTNSPWGPAHQADFKNWSWTWTPLEVA